MRETMRIQRTNRRLRRAFTLIELLLVLVILATLAAIVVPKFTKRGEQARVTAAQMDISGFSTGIKAFQIDCGRFPSTEEGLRALIEQPANANGWKGPYMEKGISNDPWGKPYIYRYPGQHPPCDFDLYSLGPDGQEGTEDDVANWK